jgi:hypothetical protein
MMSATLVELTPADIAPMIRGLLKDKRYRASSLGALVGRFCRWFKNEEGATPDSLRDYESVLRRMTLTLADVEPTDVTPAALLAMVGLLLALVLMPWWIA